LRGWLARQGRSCHGCGERDESDNDRFLSRHCVLFGLRSAPRRSEEDAKCYRTFSRGAFLSAIDARPDQSAQSSPNRFRRDEYTQSKP
jgi:hypothetical protein